MENANGMRGSGKRATTAATVGSVRARGRRRGISVGSIGSIGAENAERAVRAVCAVCAVCADECVLECGRMVGREGAASMFIDVVAGDMSS